MISSQQPEITLLNQNSSSDISVIPASSIQDIEELIEDLLVSVTSNSNCCPCQACSCVDC